VIAISIDISKPPTLSLIVDRGIQLTHTDAVLSVTQHCIITVKPPVVVTWLQEGTGLAGLPGTHLTATTAIQNQAGTKRAWRRVRGTVTGIGTVLGHCL
jgi:hypothetical protein